MRACLCVAAVVSVFGCSSGQQSSGGPDAGAATRTVSGALATVYRAQDGGEVSKPFDNTGRETKVVAAWVLTDGGYEKLSVANDGGVAFTIEGVPEGSYYLQVDVDAPGSGPGFNTPQAFEASFYPFTTSTPDLSSRGPGRPDLAGDQGATVNATIDGLLPWTVNDRITLQGESIDSEADSLTSVLADAGVTSVSKKFFFGGLPDASKGDVEYVYQLSASDAGSGATAGSVRAASRFAQLDLTLADGSTTNLSLTLGAPAQTGTLSGNLAGSKWAAMLQQSGPSATLIAGGQLYRVLTYPAPASFPDQIRSQIGLLASVTSPPLVNVDYGAVTYGQFLGAQSQEVRSFVLTADYKLPQPGTSATVDTFNVFYQSEELMPAAANLSPTLGPPLSPRIQGLDALQAQTGVTLSPVISWSAPSLGAPTSYVVTIGAASGTPVYVDLTFNVYGATSLQIPAGLLEKGATYAATITAFQAPWDVPGHAPLRHGVPSVAASTVTAVFAP